MTEQQITFLIQSEIKKSQTTNQYIVSRVPFHVHNNVDSPQLFAENINYLFFMTWGKIALVGGTVTITNPLIRTTSIILATNTQQITKPLSAICNLGSATITDSGAGTTDVVNYLIIF